MKDGFDEYPDMTISPFSFASGGTNTDKIRDMFVKKKELNIPIEVEDYSEDDVEELQTFCNKYNILGIGFGKMSPKETLQMLKSKMGILPVNKDENIISNISNKQLLKG